MVDGVGRIASNWAKVLLGDVATFKTGKLNSNASVTNGEYPFFTCSQETFRTNTYSFDDEVVLLAGNNANGVYPLKYFKGKFDVYQRTYVIRPVDGSQVLTRFLYYALQPKLGLLQSISTGAATKFLTIGLLNNLEVILPNHNVQERVINVLGAYDDLIENNTRRIRILEKMAQTIYREWFVKFRFPGHERVKVIDSPLGPIPEGWEISKVVDLLKKVKRKVKIKKQNYLVEGPVPIIDQGRGFIGGYTPDREAIVDDLPLIVFGDHTRILKYIDFPFACGADGTQLLRTSSDRMPMSLFYYTLLEIDLSDFAYARHFKFLKEKEVLLPDAMLARQFSDFADTLRDQIRVLNDKNAVLRKTHDLLLPQLVSGELSLDAVDDRAVALG